MTVLVEFPIAEAEALLKRVGIEPLTAEEAEAAQRAAQRVVQAVKVERGTGGAAAVVIPGQITIDDPEAVAA